MKKQLILGLCILSVASCGGLSEKGRSYSTLADMFVWGDDYEAQADPQYVKVSYKEIDPSQAKEVEDDKHKSHQYNEDVDVKYVEVEQLEENETTPKEVEKIAVKEVVIEEAKPNKDTQTYTLAKRSERYKNVDETFSPNVYAILASRVVNKLLMDLPGITAENPSPTVYIADTEYADRYMPEAVDVAGNTTKEILTNSKMVKIASDETDGTYILKGRLTNINTPEIPVFKYSLSLYDRENKLIDRWTDTIRQVQNDDGSWW